MKKHADTVPRPRKGQEGPRVTVPTYVRLRLAVYIMYINQNWSGPRKRELEQRGGGEVPVLQHANPLRFQRSVSCLFSPAETEAFKGGRWFSAFGGKAHQLCKHIHTHIPTHDRIGYGWRGGANDDAGPSQKNENIRMKRSKNKKDKQDARGGRTDGISLLQ